MTLREEAEKAAREIPHHGGPAYPVEAIADAIERVAKAFAERALRQFDGIVTDRTGELLPDEYQAEAIAAAERGE